MATKPYTTLEDCAKFSGVVQSHSRSSEAIVKLDDGKKIYARSNQQTMNRRLATTRSNDRVSGYYLEATHNVVELYINGEKVAGFEKYQDYETWERQFWQVVASCCSSAASASQRPTCASPMNGVRSRDLTPFSSADLVEPLYHIVHASIQWGQVSCQGAKAMARPRRADEAGGIYTHLIEEIDE